MIIKDVTDQLENLSPLAYAEDFDNVGLLVGHPEDKVTGILVCHDVLEAVVEEAIENNCNLIVCFHPIWYKGLKRLNGSNYVERTLIKAIRHQIAIYAIHTALDNHFLGVSDLMLKALGVETSEILIPKSHYIQKLVTYTVPENTDQLMTALFEAGAGSIGNYTECSFRSAGKGTYKGNALSNPVYGQKGVRSEVEEIKIEVTFEKHLQSKILNALKSNHVYEEVAFEIHQLENKLQNVGLGKVGWLKNEMKTPDFFHLIKEKLNISVIKHSEIIKNNIQKIAFLGGAGAFAIENAINCKADIYITSDLKYHDYYRAENKIILADIGHYESEMFTKNYIFDFLKKKFTNFAIILTKTNTNPVKYF